MVWGLAGMAGGRRTFAALLACFGLLFVAAVAAVILSSQAADAERWVRHTLEVRRLNEALFARLQDATLGERGYLITRDPRYFRLYAVAKADATRMGARLASLVHDNPSAQARVHDFTRASNAQIGELDRTIGLLRLGRDADAVAAVRSHLLVDHLGEARAASAAVDAGEVRLLAAREDTVSQRRALLVGAMVFSLVATVAVGLLIIAVFRRNLAELARGRDELAEEMRKREATEGQLRQSQKMESLGQLSGGIAHDFNNMLAIVIGNLDLLARRLEAGDARQRFVELALEGAQRAAALTQSLLAFSRQQPLEPRSVDVNKTVAEVSRLLRSTLGEAVMIETVLAGGLWPAHIDRSRLESAVLNLALNARDAMPGGGKLTVETANTYLDDAYARAEGLKPGQYVQVALTDTGVGMSRALVERAFDPFFTTKAPGQGTGLGLSQVHGFIKQSEGHVKIYSEPGRGTTIKLYLPRSLAPVDERRPGPEPAPNAARSGAWVLVVEDEDGVREFACGALHELGYRTHGAADGATALERLAAYPEIELMLTDVVMPKMSGRVLADRALALRPDLKVLFMTGYTRNAIVHNGVLDPDARLLSKPFTLAALATKVREALEG